MNISKYLHFSRPTAEQTNVLKEMDDFLSIENQYDFMVLCGAAGTGKTSITAALIGYLSSHSVPTRGLCDFINEMFIFTSFSKMASQIKSN